MEALHETTDWGLPHHTYLLDGSKCVAYIQEGTTTPIYFSKPLQFDQRGRKFQEVTPNPFKVQKAETRLQVEGSKGAVYWVDPDAQTCTCPGFVFRGTCKHLKVLE